MINRRKFPVRIYCFCRASGCESVCSQWKSVDNWLTAADVNANLLVGVPKNSHVVVSSLGSWIGHAWLVFVFRNSQYVSQPIAHRSYVVWCGGKPTYGRYNAPVVQSYGMVSKGGKNIWYDVEKQLNEECGLKNNVRKMTTGPEIARKNNSNSTAISQVWENSLQITTRAYHEIIFIGVVYMAR